MACEPWHWQAGGREITGRDALGRLRVWPGRELIECLGTVGVTWCR
jgi:hypothetical protein